MNREPAGSGIANRIRPLLMKSQWRGLSDLKMADGAALIRPTLLDKPGQAMMFKLFKRSKIAPDKNIISLEKAKAIIEAEVQRREWQSYGLRRYSLERRDEKTIWHCYAMPPHKEGRA